MKLGTPMAEFFGSQSLGERWFRLRRNSLQCQDTFHLLAQNDIYFNFNFFLEDLRLLSLTEHALDESFSALEELHSNSESRLCVAFKNE